eukprot:m.114676 g.114676  ORF g.114676 m.114676 type:complete len:468 (-) comp28364_c0_seq1:65-1468(-)
MLQLTRRKRVCVIQHTTPMAAVVMSLIAGAPNRCLRTLDQPPSTGKVKRDRDRERPTPRIRMSWRPHASTRHQNHASVFVPPSLSDAVDTVIKRSGLTRRELKQDTYKLHQFLFSRQTTKDTSGLLKQKFIAPMKTEYLPWLNFGPRESIAFLAGRQPICYAAITRVLEELKLRKPDFSPKHILDFGSGVGTTMWATKEQWPDSDVKFVCVDKSQAMIELSTAVHTECGSELLREIDVSYRQLLPIPKRGDPEYDLVVCSMTLSELIEQNLRKKILLELWAHTREYLVIVEAGNAQGFELLHQARETLLKQTDCYIISPCAHHLKCPRHGALRPCHFPVRATIPKSQRFSLNETSNGIRAEKLSYLIVARGRRDIESQGPKLSRVIAAPSQRTGHIVFEVCKSVDDDGEEPEYGCSERVTVPRSTGAVAWRDSKHRKWGDVLPVYPKNIVTPITRSTTNDTNDGEPT